MNKLLSVLSLTLFFSLGAASWVPVKFSITADNAYAVYAGSSQVLQYFGSEYAQTANEIFTEIEYYPAGPFGKHNPTPPQNPLYMDPAHNVYVVAWSDARERQGVLMNIVINGVPISSDNAEWRVFPTKFFRQPSGAGVNTPACEFTAHSLPYDRDVNFGETPQAPPCPEWVQSMIQQADDGNLWQIPTRGDSNTAASIWQNEAAGMPNSVKWMWYNSTNLCSAALNRPFALGDSEVCHHGEPLLFKIPVSAWRADPDTCQARATNGTGANHKFCYGTCPTRADGTVPVCASIYDNQGSLRQCECCKSCDVVVMPNILENYCSGQCPNCQNCEVTGYGYLNNQPYVKSCGCQSPTYDRCGVDHCSNKCVGPCPENMPCVPTVVSSLGQIERCDCEDNERCRRVVQPTGQVTCSGICMESHTTCKGLYYNGELKDCTCDCCELVRFSDPRQNYCLGKCDNKNMACDAKRYDLWTDPATGQRYEVIVDCGCRVNSTPHTK